MKNNTEFYTSDFLGRRKPFFLRLIESLVIWEFLLFSGGVRFYIAHEKLCMFVLLISSFALFEMHRKKECKHNFKILGCLWSWLFLTSIIINPMEDLTFSKYFCYPLACCLAISVMNFETFKKKILNYLNFICALSIIVQIGHDYFGLPVSWEFFSNSPTHFGMSMHFFHTTWGEHRMSSIYWEPGQFQVVLTFVLCLWFKELSDHTQLKVNLRRFSLILVSFLMSRSTMGYFVLAVLIFLVIIFSSLSNKYKFFIPFFVCLVAIPIYFIYNSDVVQEKLSQKDSLEDNSYNIRMRDNLVMLREIEEKPVFGYGITSSELRRINKHWGNETASNGWLNSATRCGIPYIVMLLFFIYAENRKRGYNKLNAFLMMIPLCLSQSNEAFLFFPYLWMYIFRFKQSNEIPSLIKG